MPLDNSCGITYTLYIPLMYVSYPISGYTLRDYIPYWEVSMTDIVAKQTQAPKATTTKKPTAGFGRGWHLRKEFTAPNGDRYSFGKLITVETK
jgi:hypothetical protein